MRITSVETFHVKPRWIFVKVSTDEGICGWGECDLEGRNLVTAAAVDALKDMIVGKDPRNIEYLYKLMYAGAFYRGGAAIFSGISGIEQALWDIKGKWLNVPVWQLLGGKSRDRIRMYAHIVGNIDYTDLDENECRRLLVENAKLKVGKGIKSLKTPFICPYRYIETPDMVDRFVERIALVREAIGKKIDLAVDFHGRVSPAMSPWLCKELEQFGLMFVEEPVLPENVDEMALVAQKTIIPIATGERKFTTFDFREILEKHAAYVLQPDVCHTGGISQVMKIAAMGETYLCTIAPHNPLGPLALAACLQVDTVINDFLAQEFPSFENGWDLGGPYLKQPFEIKDGYIEVSDKPGMGIEVDEVAVRDNQYDGRWEIPRVSFRDDNSLGEW